MNHTKQKLPTFIKVIHQKKTNLNLNIQKWGQLVPYNL